MRKMDKISTQDDLKQLLTKQQEITNTLFYNLDFQEVAEVLDGHRFTECICFGCTFPDTLKQKCRLVQIMEFPQIDLPYTIYPDKLYSQETLFKHFIPGKPESYQNTLDKIIHNHFLQDGLQAKSMQESLARALHDQAITHLLYQFLAQFDEKKIVGVMGGHGLSRQHKSYKQVVYISKKLTEEGYLMISGGGSGAMEATHLGAWLAGRKDDEVEQALGIVAQVPYHNDPQWLDKSFEVLNRWPESSYISLGIPSWACGYEPPTPFATHIAKYFNNSLREDALVSVAKGGILFTPGSAGTIMEVFQDAAQNHYKTFGYASPMIFLGTEYWQKEKPIYPLLEDMGKEGKYENLILSLCDKEEEVLASVRSFTAG